MIGHPEGNAAVFGEGGKALYLVSHDGQEAKAAAQVFVVPPLGPLVKAGSLSAEPLRVTSATLHATVNPETEVPGETTKYHFEYITEAAYLKNQAENSDPFTGATATLEGPPLAGAFAEDEVSSAIEGLRPGTAYRFCLLAANGKGDGNATCLSSEDEGAFTTLPAAVISEQAVSKVTATSAQLEGLINPLGVETGYHFEYLPEAGYQENVADGREGFAGATGAPVPDATVGSAEEDHPVSLNIQGLAPSTAYRYRLVANNHCNPAEPAEVCLAAGSPSSFTTEASAAGEGLLPDGRQWEMVSPPDKHGAKLEPISEAVTQAAAQGTAITYVANGSSEEQVQGNARDSQLLSTRTPAGWVTQDIAPPHGGATEAAAGGGQDYRWFSEDLALAAVEPAGPFSPFLSSAASEQTAYLRDTTGTYTPLVTGCPAAESCPPHIQEHANVPPGTVFGDQGGQHNRGPEFVGASADASHVVLYSQVALTEQSLPANLGSPTGAGLYEWSAGHLTLVSLLPPTLGQQEKGEAGTPASDPTLGVGDPGLGASRGASKRGAISAEGSRVVFSEQVSGVPVGLYLRDVPAAQTVQLDAAQAGCAQTECQGGSGVFQLATEGGGVQRVFFTDEHPLMKGAGDGALYECEIVEVAGGVECRLSDLTPRPADEESPAVQGSVIGSNTDGSWLYFVASGVLSQTPSLGGEKAQPGQNNLYVWHEGTVSLVAVLSGGDSPDWGEEENGGPADTQLYKLTARVSADGHWLAFMSERSLTGYDNRDARSGQPDEEVFLYHAGVGRGVRLV